MKLAFKPKDSTLTGPHLAASLNPQKRQLVSYDLNVQEVEKMFRELPWATVLITPRFYFFREAE